jgi:quercetin dioxygenase-like cupin family protein
MRRRQAARTRDEPYSRTSRHSSMKRGTVPDKPNALKELEGVVSLAETVQYQSGAVVSRTLLKRPSGTVTAFAFDQGEGLSEHTAAFDALVLMIEGESEVSVSGVPHRLAQGHLLQLPAGQPHALKALTRFKMLLIMVKG